MPNETKTFDLLPKRQLKYLLAVIIGAASVGCCTLVLVLLACGEVALAEWLTLHIKGDCPAATVILIVAHAFSVLGFLLVIVNVTIHHHRRTPVGSVMSCMLEAIERRIDRFSAP